MTGLRGLRVLIVEDEALIAMMAEDMLDGLGCAVAGVATSVGEAHAAIERDDFDAAMLDVNLNGDTSMGVASALKASGRRFLFTTGYGSNGVSAEHADVPVLAKPYAIADLERALAAFANARSQAAGTSSITSISDSNLG
ncbi:MAG: response regulator [Sphingomonadaceae bacterium]|nr:response regulator [Sphingomonadaceae bacterium]